MKITFKEFWKRFWAVVEDKRAELDIDAIAADWRNIEKQLSIKIGGTTYLVSSFFKQDSKSQSTALDKIQRLIEKDATQAS